MSKYTIPTIFTAVDKFSQPVSKMAATAQTKFAKLETKFRRVGDNAMATAKKSALIGAAIAVPLIAASKSAVDFEQKMSNVSTLVDTNQESMEDMGNEVLMLASRLPKPIDELTTSLYDIRSAGIPASEAMNTLDYSAKLATAGLADTTESTNIMTSALNAFKSEGLTSAQTADILFKTVKAGKTTISQLSTAFGANAGIVQSANVTLADFSAATAALTTVGTPASQAQNQIRASVIAMQKPTADMAKIFKHLGVTSEKELIAKKGGLVGAFEAINAAGTDMGINLAKAWSSSEASAAVTSLTGATKEAYVSTFADMTTGAEKLTEAFDKQNSTGAASMQKLRNNVEVMSVKIGTALLPVINQLAESLVPIIDRFAQWMDRNPELVSTLAGLAVKAVGVAGAISAISFAVGIGAKAFKLVRGSIVAYNVVLGISAAISGKAAISIGQHKAALIAYNIATKAVTVATRIFNAVLAMNPIGLIVTGLTLAAAAAYGLSKAFSSVTTQQRLQNEVKNKAIDLASDEIANVKTLFTQLRHTKRGSEEYATVLKKIDAIQPGLIDKYKDATGALRDQAGAEKELTKNIMARAVEQARAELASEKIKAAVEKSMKADQGFVTGMINFASRTANMGDMGTKINKLEAAGLMQEANILLEQNANKSGEVTNVDATRQEVTNKQIKEQVQTLKFDFSGMPPGVSTQLIGGNGGNMPSMTGTN